jgi:sugar lactone lactonase YvrE/mono/diheme cytochrome c family protein
MLGWLACTSTPSLTETDPTLRAIAGLELFSQRGCAACHCNDAVGGCNLNAPNLQGISRERVNQMLREDQLSFPHPLKMSATDEQLDDLVLFLQSLRPGAPLRGSSHVTQGYVLYVRGGCVVCHLSSGQGVNQGGLGAAIAGTDPENVYAALSGAIPCHPRQREVPENPSADCRFEITTNDTVASLTDTSPPDVDAERVLLSYFLSFIAPPSVSGRVEPCNRVPGEICTAAGNGISGYSQDGVAATESLLFSPLELALTDWNADGVLDLVVDDWNNHRIRIVYLDTVVDGVADRIESIAGTGKVTGADALNHPNDVAFDAAGALVMANWHNQNMYRYARGLVDGAQRDQLAGLCDLRCHEDDNGPTRVDETFIALPTSVAIHPDGRIFFSEGGCSRIRILTIGEQRTTQQPLQCITPVNLYGDGIIETLAGRREVNGYAGDGGLASDAIFNIDNSPLNPNFGISFSPEDPPRRLYVADTLNNCIRFIDLSSEPPTIQLFAGSPGAAGYMDGPANQALFNFPANVYVHDDGFVYVADTRNHAIRRIDPDGRNVTTVVGTGRRGFNGDNVAATGALLDSPGGVVIHPDGRLFIADLGNNRVRVVFP